MSRYLKTSKKEQVCCLAILLKDFFIDTSIVQGVYLMGTIPLINGINIIFYNIFKTILQKIPKRLEPIKTPGGLSRQEGDSRIGAELFVEFDHFVQREVGAHIAVQDEEGGWVAGTNLIAEVVNTAGGPQRSVFL